MSQDFPESFIDYPDIPPARTGAVTLLRYAARFVAIGLLVFFLFSVMWVFVYRYTQPPSSFIMRRDRQGGMEIDRRSIALDKISDALKLAVIAAEDQQFCQHNGFDWTAVAKAQENNERRQTTTHGASTISMQTAKNAFLWPTRSWIRKGFEAYFTALIEILWPKERILEVYLNIAEWGEGIYGAEAAARHYFGVSAIDLNANQAALLAAALPQPTRSNPGQPSAYLSSRAATIENDMILLADVLGECLR